MTETTFWQSLRKKLNLSIYALKLNLNFAAGVPDVWLSGGVQDLWLELKYLQKLPPIIDPMKLLSTLQKAWLIRRYSEGRRVGVLIGSPDGHLYFPALSWQCSVTRGTWIQTSSTTAEIVAHLIDDVGPIDRGVGYDDDVAIKT
jgi:hypothetical protein